MLQGIVTSHKHRELYLFHDDLEPAPYKLPPSVWASVDFVLAPAMLWIGRIVWPRHILAQRMAGNTSANVSIQEVSHCAMSNCPSTKDKRLGEAQKVCTAKFIPVTPTAFHVTGRHHTFQPPSELGLKPRTRTETSGKEYMLSTVSSGFES